MVSGMSEPATDKTEVNVLRRFALIHRISLVMCIASAVLVFGGLGAGLVLDERFA
jgi:hypothetical protein